MRLAIDGGKPAVTGPLKPYNSIGPREIEMAHSFMKNGNIMSGYLGGNRHGGYWVNRLEGEWAAKFKCKHAIAVNSATSGLLIACQVAGIGPRDRVITTPYTMSATAAAPKFLGASVEFADIESDTFCLDMNEFWDRPVAAHVVATNLFGHPASLHDLRRWCDSRDSMLIEDNAQSPLAMENGVYAGTIGHMGVFSLNVHKHFQVGEGGIVCTNDDDLADRLRLARNHGEMAAGAVGLNLRMTELTAAIACVQLERAEQLVGERVEIAHSIIDKRSPLATCAAERKECRHVYYCIPWLVQKDLRGRFVAALQAEGLPVRGGYLQPLYKLPAFANGQSLPTVERIEDEIVLYENCAYTPTREQIRQIGEAFWKVSESLAKVRATA